MFELGGKKAMVTGASRGIGRAAALALASRGAHVVVGFGKGEAEASAVVEAITDAGGSAEMARVDVSDFRGTETVIADLAKRLGGLDVLVANAGISIDGLVLRLTEEDLDRTLAVNLKGAVACAKSALKPMMRARSGRIIFVSSVVGETGNAGQTAYAASKGALLAVTKSLAREYASRNVTVNAIAPGYVETDMTRALTDDQRAAVLGQVPLGRVGAVMDIGAAVVYLASDEAGYVTGHTLRVNGGMYM